MLEQENATTVEQIAPENSAIETIEAIPEIATIEKPVKAKKLNGKQKRETKHEAKKSEAKREAKTAKKETTKEYSLPANIAKKLPKVGESFSLTEKQVIDCITAHNEQGLLDKYMLVCTAKGQFVKGDLLHSKPDQLPKIRPVFSDNASGRDAKSALVILSYFFARGHLAVSMRAIVKLLEEQTGRANIEQKACSMGDTGAFKLRQGLHRLSKSDTDEKRVNKSGQTFDTFARGGRLYALKTNSISYKGGYFFPIWGIEYTNPLDAELKSACEQAIRGMF